MVLQTHPRLKPAPGSCASRGPVLLALLLDHVSSGHGRPLTAGDPERRPAASGLPHPLGFLLSSPSGRWLTVPRGCSHTPLLSYSSCASARCSLRLTAARTLHCPQVASPHPLPAHSPSLVPSLKGTRKAFTPCQCGSHGSWRCWRWWWAPRLTGWKGGGPEARLGTAPEQSLSCSKTR